MKVSHSREGGNPFSKTSEILDSNCFYLETRDRRRCGITVCCGVNRERPGLYNVRQLAVAGCNLTFRFLRTSGATASANRLRWTPSAEPDLCYYRIYHNGVRIGSTAVTEYIDSGLTTTEKDLTPWWQ